MKKKPDVLGFKWGYFNGTRLLLVSLVLGITAVVGSSLQVEMSEREKAQAIRDQKKIEVCFSSVYPKHKSMSKYHIGERKRNTLFEDEVDRYFNEREALHNLHLIAKYKYYGEVVEPETEVDRYMAQQEALYNLNVTAEHKAEDEAKLLETSEMTGLSVEVVRGLPTLWRRQPTIKEIEQLPDCISRFIAEDKMNASINEIFKSSFRKRALNDKQVFLLLIVSILNMVTGFFIILRLRCAWVFYTIITFNPILWIINIIYIKNRWKEFENQEKIVLQKFKAIFLSPFIFLYRIKNRVNKAQKLVLSLALPLVFVILGYGVISLINNTLYSYNRPNNLEESWFRWLLVAFVLIFTELWWLGSNNSESLSE